MNKNLGTISVPTNKEQTRKFVWRMKDPCANCPFNKSGAGLHLRKSLYPGRWREILLGLRMGQGFHCHKTTDETGDGSNLLCAGAISYQEKIGTSSNLQRVMERLDYCHGKSNLDEGGKP